MKQTFTGNFFIELFPCDSEHETVSKILVVFSNYLYYYHQDYWKMIADLGEDQRYNALYSEIDWLMRLYNVTNELEERVFFLRVAQEAHLCIPRVN